MSFSRFPPFLCAIIFFETHCKPSLRLDKSLAIYNIHVYVCTVYRFSELIATVKNRRFCQCRASDKYLNKYRLTGHSLHPHSILLSIFNIQSLLSKVNSIQWNCTWLNANKWQKKPNKYLLNTIYPPSPKKNTIISITR